MNKAAFDRLNDILWREIPSKNALIDDFSVYDIFGDHLNEDIPNDAWELYQEYIEPEIMDSFVYYSDAIKFLSENDPSLQISLDKASEFGYSPKDLNSCMLAGFVCVDVYSEIYSEYADEIDDLLNS